MNSDDPLTPENPLVVDQSVVPAGESLKNPYAAEGHEEKLLLPPNPEDEERQRWWTPLAATGVALLLCLGISTVMIFVAMVAVTGDTNIHALANPDYLAGLMESRLGLCLMVIPPQLMLVVPSVLGAWLSPVETRKRLSLVRGRWPVWAWFAAAAAAPLVGMISTVLLSFFLTESANLKMMSDVFRGHSESGFLIPLALIIGMTPAVCEEILFRGYVQTRLTRSFGPGIGIFVASFLFAAFHMDFVHIVAVFPLGVYLGFVVWRSGSLFPAVLAHFVNNVISVVGVAFAPEGKTDVLALPTMVVSLLILGTGIIGAAAVVVATVQYGRPAQPEV